MAPKTLSEFLFTEIETKIRELSAFLLAAFLAFSWVNYYKESYVSTETYIVMMITGKGLPVEEIISAS